MRLFKKLDAYILRAYLQLFAGTFFICLLIFLMQLGWRYVNDLVGKGLSFDVLASFFWYASLTIVPISMPLAILLAALITFGNLGERLELLSMKAAGISLARILRPVFLFVFVISIGSYYYQNKIAPEAAKQMSALLYDMRKKSPELAIPEGTFYNLPNSSFNIFVEQKDPETGVLYGVMIYDVTNGHTNAQITLADSARLQSTADGGHIKFTFYGGERFQSFTQAGSSVPANLPYMRSSFNQEVVLISYSDSLQRTDADEFSRNAVTKDISKISNGIDSISTHISQKGHIIYDNMLHGSLMARTLPAREDSAKIVASAAQAEPFDSIMAHLNDEQKKEVWRLAADRVESKQKSYNWDSGELVSSGLDLRKHKIEWNKKFTLSVACLIFFFIGAPLGAIIRKGGLGLPVVISVLIFIFYYIINSQGEKLAKIGEWETGFGVWLSSIILGPIAAFLTYKANKDSTMFNIEGYILPLKKLWKVVRSRPILTWVKKLKKKQTNDI